ncbi:hypothetical protein ACM61V_09335 [Sphingomonas sp. TX0543]|uniref:hypothetical protein n=1 Tax=unclassified Sphingomonas TaxID=196159 RepID=UPI0010F9D497|nr:hypothetical protein [Sphingomonas sp. 3P27F8]
MIPASFLAFQENAMSTLFFYREQAAQQQAAADAATLDNVRERCQRASNAWAALAARSERAENSRIRTAAEKLLAGLGDGAELNHAAT